VQPLHGAAALGAADRRREHLAIHLDQLHGGPRIGLAHRAVERQHAQRLIAGVERHDHAGVAVREVQHAVERVAVAVAVVVLGECPRAARLERLAQAREVLELQRVTLDALVGEPAAGRPGYQAALLEHEDRGEIVGRHARQPVEAAAQQVVEALVVAGERRELAQVTRQVHVGHFHATSLPRHVGDRATVISVINRYIGVRSPK
jgi:hypothetical protein